LQYGFGVPNPNDLISLSPPLFWHVFMLFFIERRLSVLRSAPQAQVVRELNSMIDGWAAYNIRAIPAATLRTSDDLKRDFLLHWASQRHHNQDRH